MVLVLLLQWSSKLTHPYVDHSVLDHDLLLIIVSRFIIVAHTTIPQRSLLLP